MDELILVDERKFSEFFPDQDRFEASGILYRDGFFYVVFDNLYQVGRIRADLKPEKSGNKLLGKRNSEKSGYEGIAFNELSQSFYTLAEAIEWPDLSYRAQVHEYNTKFARVGGWWLDFRFGEEGKGGNKGFEGLSWLQRQGREYLLALCEGNNCSYGKAGKKPGNGRIQVFEKRNGTWAWIASLIIPPTVKFKDHAGMGLSGDRVYVTSQSSSKLWMGTLHRQRWAFVDEGQQYRFPKKSGTTVYCNIEGVAEISYKGKTLLAAVSDKAKSDQANMSRRKDQSIHLFAVPD